MDTQARSHDDTAIKAIIESHIGLEGPLLPVLHALQDHFGFIPDRAVPALVDALNISKAEIHGVISFYHDFREKPAGQHVVKICRSEACQAVGADVMAERILNKLGLDWHDTSPNNAVTVEPVYCLGLCACGPAVMVDEQVIGRVDDAKLELLLKGAVA